MKKILWLLGGLLNLSPALHAQNTSADFPYKVGVAVENITPFNETLVKNYPSKSFTGYIDMGSSLIYSSGGDDQELTQIDSELETRALVYEDASGKRMAMVTLDLLTLTPEFTNDIRNRVQQSALSIDPDNIIINASHTHSAPAVHDYNKGTHHLPNPIYLAAVRNKIMLAIQRAVADLKLAKITVKSGTSNVAVYRRNDEKKIAALDNPVSQKLDVFQATDSEGKIIAVSYFLGCHPQAMYGSNAISADYVAISRAYIESQLQSTSPNAKALFFQGFGGDLDQKGMKRGVSLQTLEQQTGTNLGSQVVALLNNANALNAELTGILDIKPTKVFNLKLENSAPSTQEMNLATTLPTEFKEVNIKSSTNDVWTILFFSNEVVSEYADNVRSHYPNPSNVTLAGYTNLVVGYLPTRRMIDKDLRDCSTPPIAYEGCGSFVHYGLRKPIWHDNDFFANQKLFSDDFNGTINGASIHGLRDNTKWVEDTFLKINNTKLSDLNHNQSEGRINSVIDNMVHIEQPDGTNGQLYIRPLKNTSGLNYSGYASTYTYNFANGQAFCEILDIPNVNTSYAEFFFLVERDGDNYVGFNIRAGQIRAITKENGVVVETDSIPYCPAQHRFLRIRNQQTSASTSTMLWEVSGDGSTWQRGHARTTPPTMNLAAVRIELVGGTSQPVADPGQILIDNFNSSGPEPVYSTTIFGDDFNDNSRDVNKWNPYTLLRINGSIVQDSNVPVAEQNQRLEITPLANITNGHYNGFSTIPSFDFTNKQTTVELIQLPNAASSAEFFFTIDQDFNSFYGFSVQGGILFAQVKFGGGMDSYPLGNVDLQAHRYLRLRHEQATNSILWETSSTGNSWEVQKALTASPFISLSTMSVGLTGGTYNSQDTPGSVIVDNFSVADNGSNTAPRPLALNDSATPTAVQASITQNYPNPFSGVTTLSYYLPQAAPVIIKVYDSKGREVATVVNQKESAGLHTVDYNGANLKNGTYFYRFTTGKRTQTKPMLRVN